jgi:hypothetical protein
VKKLVLLLVAAAGGLFVFKKRRASQAEADLWHEATSSGTDAT